MAKTVLELRNITKRFGSLDILRGVNLLLNEGQTASIVGPSGAGKSTLLHIAGLMERPTSGEIFINQRSTVNFSDNDLAKERLNTIGFLFQFHHLLPDFNVLENVLIPSRLAGDDLGASTKQAKEILERLGLSARLDHKPYQLSGGEQQRTALARAVIRKPKILLCDEPTGNLDQHTAQEVFSLIWSEIKRDGVVAVVVTHNEALAQQADASYHLVEGKFVGRQEGVRVS
jgi:lipoprotein-releasing system ATP-binding protein